jgi:hypothetical protein
MKISGVMARFLPLLDIALILLGLLMIMLTQAQLRSDGPESEHGFVHLLAGWKGEQAGRCYLLQPDGTIAQEIRTDTDEDIRRVLSEGAEPTEPVRQFVMLLFDRDGWYSSWNPKKLNDIERTWNVQVVPVYNVPRPPEP